MGGRLKAPDDRAMKPEPQSIGVNESAEPGKSPGQIPVSEREPLPTRPSGETRAAARGGWRRQRRSDAVMQ